MERGTTLHPRSPTGTERTSVQSHNLPATEGPRRHLTCVKVHSIILPILDIPSDFGSVFLSPSGRLVCAWVQVPRLLPVVLTRVPRYWNLSSSMFFSTSTYNSFTTPFPGSFVEGQRQSRTSDRNPRLEVRGLPEWKMKQFLGSL